MELTSLQKFSSFMDLTSLQKFNAWRMFLAMRGPIFIFLAACLAWGNCSIWNSEYAQGHGPAGKVQQQYVSSGFESLEDECKKARRIVEHCDKGTFVWYLFRKFRLSGAQWW